MSLTKEDKRWLAALAALVVRAISEVVVGQFKTQISVQRTKDIVEFGRTGNSIYAVNYEEIGNKE